VHCLRNSKNNTERKMSSLWLGIIHTSIKWLRLNHVLVLLRGRRLAETQKLRVRLLCCAVVHHVVLIHVWLAAVSSSTTSPWAAHLHAFHLFTRTESRRLQPSLWVTWQNMAAQKT